MSASSAPPRSPADHLQLALARVLDGTGRPVGAAFLVGQRVLVTCAHVVSSAQRAHAEPSGAAVRVDFPLFRPGVAHEARLEDSVPADPDGGGDIAVLRLAQAPPRRLNPTELLDSRSFWRHGFITYGFPSGRDGGVWAHGELLSKQAAGWIQIEATRTTGHRVQPGFSGAPLWDEALGGVVGMVVAAERDESLRAAYVIAAPELAAACGARVLVVGEGECAPSCRVEDDDVLTIREAYRFGARLALLGRVEATAPSVDRDGAIAGWIADCRDHADYLDVPFDPQNTAEWRTRHASSLRASLADRYGARVGDTFQVGFYLVLAPEMAPHFEPEKRARVAGEIEQLGAQAQIPAEPLARAVELVMRADAQRMSAGILDITDVISAAFEQQLHGSRWLRSMHARVWSYASNACLAAALRSAGGGPELFDPYVSRALEVARELDVDLPPLAPLTGASATDGAVALHYMLEELAQPVVDRFRARYGDAAVHLLRLATRTYPLLILYHPDLDEGRSLLGVIEEESQALGLPAEVAGDLIAGLRSATPFDRIKEEVLDFNARMSRYLQA